MRFVQMILLVLFSFSSCDTDKIEKIDISNIDVNFLVKRFDVDYYTSKNGNFDALKSAYPYFFPEGITDSITFAKINNKDEQELFLETQKVFKDFTPFKEQFIALFKHVKYYNPKFKSPTVVGMLTNIEYNSRVIYADSLLLLSLDVYLGENHPFYADYPKYVKNKNTKEHLIVDATNAIIERQVPHNIERSFLAKMIYEGKKMHLLDVYLPAVTAREKFGYETDKFNWVQANEEQIWRYFIEEKLLFSTATNLNKRFLEIAPFSKFYREQDNLSPGQVGVWVGWQIVASYMKHNDVSLQELLQINELDLFKESKYKPRK